VVVRAADQLLRGALKARDRREGDARCRVQGRGEWRDEDEREGGDEFLDEGCLEGVLGLVPDLCAQLAKPVERSRTIIGGGGTR